MKSTLTSLIIGLLIILAVGFGGYYVINRLRASADVEEGGTTAVKSADINKDGKVDALDLNAMINAIATKSTDKKYDLNNDGLVNSLDLNILINNYTKS